MEEDFHVDLSQIASGRTKGVSGILRVKDDAEFLEASIESCIDALDELIIVYNDCSDESPFIIEQNAKKYKSKIKVYPYTPHIISTNLSYEEYCFIKKEPFSSVSLLSNYYNYALSKTTKSHVLKIDADQIYFTDRLNEICNAYRGVSKRPTLSDFIDFIRISLLFLLTRYIDFRNFNFDIQKYYNGYLKTSLWLASKYDIPLSLSGINTIYNSGVWNVPLGFESGNLNILPPFNGVGDHLIFKVDNETFYEPYDCAEYEKLISSKYNYIERLIGIKHSLPIGFTWMHLNGNRKYLYDKQKQNMKQYSDCFIPLEDFVNLDFDEFEKYIPKSLMSNNHRRTFNILYEGSKNALPLKEMEQYYFSNEYYLKRRK